MGYDGRAIDVHGTQGFSAPCSDFSRLSLQVEAIRRGIGAVIPVQLLRLFSWDDLEMFVCGQEGVDIDLLEACTEYNLCSREDRHVSTFWDVLRSFSQKEKSLFLRCEY